jgi:dihydroneopterin aldolase
MILKDSFIHLKKLRFHAFIGVGAQERLTGNDFEVDLQLQTDVSVAMKTDDVTNTVSYAEAYDEVALVMSEPCNLVENAAFKMAERMMKRWPQIAAVDVKLIKINPPMGADCDGAGVELHLINDKTQL